MKREKSIVHSVKAHKKNNSAYIISPRLREGLRSENGYTIKHHGGIRNRTTDYYFYKNKNEWIIYDKNKANNKSEPEIIEKWMGVIDDIDGDTIYVHLTQEYPSNDREETAEFSMKDISVSDRSLARKSALFYWITERRISESTKTEYVTYIKFIRSENLFKTNIKKSGWSEEKRNKIVALFTDGR